MCNYFSENDKKLWFLRHFLATQILSIKQLQKPLILDVLRSFLLTVFNQKHIPVIRTPTPLPFPSAYHFYRLVLNSQTKLTTALKLKNILLPPTHSKIHFGSQLPICPHSFFRGGRLITNLQCT